MQLKVIVLYNLKINSWVNCENPAHPVLDIHYVNKYYDEDLLSTPRAALTRFLSSRHRNRDGYTYADFEFKVFDFIYVRNLESLPSTKKRNVNTP